MTTHLSTEEKLAHFFQQNSRTLISFVVVCGALVGGFFGYNYWSHHQDSQAAESYAMLPLDEAERLAGMTALAKEFPGTGAAVRAQLHLAQQAVEKKQWDEALVIYRDLGQHEASVVRIFAQLNEAVVLEQQGQLDAAAKVYQSLLNNQQNKAKAYTAYQLGRVQLALGNQTAAQEAFTKAQDEGLGSPIAERASERLLWLQVGQK